jgi:subtilase-type serine protease
MMHLRAPLLCSTALAALISGVLVAQVAAAPLVVSAPAPGATLTPSGNLLVNLLTVGDKTGEAGTLIIGPGIAVNATTGGIIGNETGATGTLTVSGTGASLTVDEYLKVGNLGTGTLRFENGASGTITGTVYVGDYDNLQTPTKGGTGQLSVDGAGTNVVVDLLDVRSFGNSSSSVRVTNGAHLTTLLNFYGRGNSDIYINGAGTVLKVGARDDDEVTYGNVDGWFSPDAGHIELSGGALLDADGSYIGGSNTATMLVTGAGTRWLNGLPLYIGGTGNGDEGNGTVVVADGAYVRAATSAVGVDTGSVGKLTITGAGTIFEVVPNASAGSPGNFRVGFNGTGTVTVSNGGLLKAANQINIATNGADGNDPASVGVLNIGAAEGDAATAAGYLDGGALGVVFGEGDATLVFNHTDTNYVFDQMMSGSGATIKHLAGTTRLSAASADLEGTAYVSGGKLLANADFNQLDFDISGTGLLGGTGTVGGIIVHSGGTLSPGDNSMDTLDVTGDLVFEAGSHLAMELGPNGQDKIQLGDQITGSIATGAILDLTLNQGIDATQTYKIIALGAGTLLATSDGGFTVNDNASLVDTSVTYGMVDGADVSFATVQNWAGFVDTRNQKATAAAIEALGFGSDLYDKAMFLSDDELAQGFDQLSGEIHGTVGATLTRNTSWLRNAALGRFDDLGESTAADDALVMSYSAQPDNSPFAALTPDQKATTGWFSGFGSLARSDGNGNAAASETRSGGVLAGADTEIAGWRLGLVGGYGHDAVDASDRASTADIDTLYAGTYAGTALNSWRIKLGAGLGYSRVATERHTLLLGSETLAGEYGAWTGQAFSELGYVLDLGGASVEPFGQLALVGLARDAYAETGGPAGLVSDTETSAVGYTTIGFRTETEVGGATLKGALAWQHAYGDVDAAVAQHFAGGDEFTVAGTPIAADSVALQVALEQALATGANIGLVYDGAFAEDRSEHSLTGRVDVKF